MKATKSNSWLRSQVASAAILIFVIAISACSTPRDGDRPQSGDIDVSANRHPNIVIFYADDLGYGDLSVYGATGINTPNIDRLAMNGMLFTDAHAASATCSPSRYALLTGEYGFRSQASILAGDAPALISPSKKTLPDMLQSAGYITAVIGKWHLGLGDGFVDWNAPVKPGPLEIGFDYSFLIPATGDRVPTVYLEGHSVVGLDSDDPITVSYRTQVGDRPTGRSSPELLRYKADAQHSGSIINGVSRIGFMAGGRSAEWVDEEMPFVFTEKAIDFVRENRDRPFFLYFPFHDPHVPRLPHPRFQGSTNQGPRGDAIVQMDWMTGEIMDAIEELGLLEDTLVIFSSDNGPVLNDGYYDQSSELIGDHQPAGPFRGGKYSAFEAGARVPTIASWPGRIDNGESSALVSQVDLFASLARLLNQELAPDIAIDSEDQLAAWLGKDPIGRSSLFKQSIPTFVLRRGNWKYVEPSPSYDIRRDFVARKGIESGGNKAAQLYNLSDDPAEKDNLAGEYPELVSEMQAEIDRIRSLTESSRNSVTDGIINPSTAPN